MAETATAEPQNPYDKALSEDPALLDAMARRDSSADEVEQSREMAAARQRRLERVKAIGDSVTKYVQEAVSARESSGVESRWREDMIYYYGSADIARTVRGVIDTALADKGTQRQGNSAERTTRSTISVNITRPKVNAAFSRLSDMLLPVDDRNFAIEPTPKPTLGVEDDDDPNALTAGPGETGAVMTNAQRIELVRNKAKKCADGMQREIDDNLTECDYNSEARKLLFQAACLGTGVIKGPVAATHTERAWREEGGQWKMDMVDNVVPESRWVDIWNCYPDPAAGGIVKNMRYFVEADEYNTRMLRALRNQPGYLTDQIDMCLREPPAAVTRQKSQTQIVDGSYQPQDHQMYTIHIVTCEMTKGDLETLGVNGLGGKTETTLEDGTVECELHPCPEASREDAIGAVVVMCNGRPIKAYLNPLASGDLGYDVFCYEPVHGQVFGLGVSYLLRSPQRVMSTTWRMIMDNAALTVGGLVVVERDGIEPSDGNWNLYGGKVFYKTTSFTGGGKVEDAFKVYNMDSRLQELEAIIQLAMKFAEDETSLPSLMEGQQGAAPDTVGGMTLLMNSANTILKVLAKRFDDSVTRPHIRRYYEWHMLHNPDSDIKGDFNVLARGSSHLVVRDLARQSLVGFMQYTGNPALACFFKTGGYMALRKVAEANHLTPDDLLVSEEEAPKVWAQFQQQMAAAAQAKAGGSGDGGAAAARVNLEGERLKADMADRERQRMHEQNMAVMKYAHEKSISIEQARKEMAAVLLKEQAQNQRQANELAHANESPTHQGI